MLSANEATLTNKVVYYLADGFRFEFIFCDPPVLFSSSVGDYQGSGNDVFHAHQVENSNQSNSYCEVVKINVSGEDGGLFHLGGFSVATNTAEGGVAPLGSELVWFDSSKAPVLFTL